MTSRAATSVALALALVVSIALVSARARADDWLAVFPACAQGPDARAPGLMRILYPRAGLPALVTAGDRLIARVRVPSGLTPPPGVQQDRALRYWKVVLVGSGEAITSGADLVHRYVLRVVDVRPDAGGTLVYRATVPIPAWVAPGTYALRMSAPGGSATVTGAVRVIEAGHAPRIALLGLLTDDALAVREVLAQSEVDVWVGAAPPAAQGSSTPPVLAMPAPPIALRVGRDAVVLGRCDDPSLSFGASLGSVAELEHLRVRDAAFHQMPSEREVRALDSTTARALDPTARARVVRLPTGDVVIDVPSTVPAPIALTLLVRNDGRATRVIGATSATFWPATEIAYTQSMRTLALRITARPGASVRVTRAPAARLQARIEVSPDPVAAGLPVRFLARASRPARFLWRHGRDLSGVGASFTHTYIQPGVHAVDVLAVTNDGIAERARGSVTIQPRRTSGCSASGGASPFAVELLLAVILWHIRRVGTRLRE